MKTPPMNRKSTLKELLRLVLLTLALSGTPGYAQIDAPAAQVPASTKAAGTLPVGRTLTSSDGRKMEGIILKKDGNSIRFRRATDNKEFDLEISKLSADDQAFAATIQVTAPLGPSDKKTKVLYVVEPQSVVSDYYTIDALAKAGYDITLATYKVPTDGWIVNAEERGPNSPDGGPGENLYSLTTKRLDPNLKAVLFEAVKLADYDILFVNIARFKPETEIIRKWPRAFANAKKPAFRRDQGYYKMIGRRGTRQHNFIFEDNGIVRYWDDLEFEAKSLKRSDENGDYDPAVTRKLLILLRKMMGDKAPVDR
jgi:hypothetical protein